jgi:hypothetical protein
MVMATERDWYDALWSAYSWQFFTNGFFRSMFVVDGIVTPSMRSQANQIMLGSRVVPAASYLPEAERLLPNTAKFFQRYRYGRKLAAVLVTSRTCPLLYTDSDVLVFRPPIEILSHVETNSDVPLYNKGGGGHAWNAPIIIDLMIKNGISPLDGFNCGLMFIPEGLDLQFLTKFGEQIVSHDPDHFTDQSIFNALLSSKRAKALDPIKYSISERGMYFYESDLEYASLVTRHFTGVVRHKMYRAGMPLLAKQFIC